MVRAALFVLVLAGLAASGWTLRANHLQQRERVEVRVLPGQELAERELVAAAAVMDEARALVGTYTETSLRRFEDVTIVYATESRYCLLAVKAGHAFHLAGPGGTPSPGRCPLGR